MKNKILKICNSQDGLKRLDIKGEKISLFEDTVFKQMQNEVQEHTGENIDLSAKWGNMKEAQIRIIGISEGGEGLKIF